MSLFELKVMSGSTKSIKTCFWGGKDPNSAVNVLNNVPEIKATLVIYALCMVLGIAGNLITLVTMCTDDRRTKTVTNVFLTSLAVKKILLSQHFLVCVLPSMFFLFSPSSDGEKRV